MKYRVRPSNLLRDTWIVMECGTNVVIADFDSVWVARRVATLLNRS